MLQNSAKLILKYSSRIRVLLKTNLILTHYDIPKSGINFFPLPLSPCYSSQTRVILPYTSFSDYLSLLNLFSLVHFLAFYPIAILSV